MVDASQAQVQAARGDQLEADLPPARPERREPYAKADLYEQSCDGERKTEADVAIPPSGAAQPLLSPARFAGRRSGSPARGRRGGLEPSQRTPHEPRDMHL
jgi:hypothetical protein